MDNKDVPGRKSPSRRLFLSASAATAVVTPIVSGAAGAAVADAATGQPAASGAGSFDPDLRKMLGRAVDTAGNRSPAASPQAVA